MKALIVTAEIILGMAILAGHGQADSINRGKPGEAERRANPPEVITEHREETNDPRGSQTAKTQGEEKWLTVTGYNSVPEQTDGSPCVAANGQDICVLREAGSDSCAGSFPFGTELEIPGFGTCVVRDRTHPRFKDRIDIYFGGRDRVTAARAWGVQRLPVRIAQ